MPSKMTTKPGHITRGSVLDDPAIFGEKQAFEGGATRSKKDIDLSLLPKSAIMAIGRRLTLGAERHGRNNWRKGGEEFRLATITHLMEHLLDYIENGNSTEANTDAIICNAAFLCEYEQRIPFKPKDVPGGK